MSDEIRCALSYEPDETRSSPGRLIAKLLSYGEIVTHEKGPERFEPRSLQWSDSDGLVLWDSHDTSPRRPVGIMHPVQGDRDVSVDYRLPDSSAGRRIAAQVKSGEIRGLSIEFRSVEERREGGLRRIFRAWISGAAAVASPAYSSAVVEVRNKPAEHRYLLL